MYNTYQRHARLRPPFRHLHWASTSPWEFVAFPNAFAAQPPIRREGQIFRKLPIVKLEPGSFPQKKYSKRKTQRKIENQIKNGTLHNNNNNNTKVLL